MNDHQRPTKVRFVVVAAASLMSVLLYLDRFCISFAEMYIQEDLGLTDLQVGWVLGAFFWTYALAQVPSGWLTDRFGSRIMLTIYVLSWSALTAFIGLANGFLMLLILRLWFGICQAGAYPTASSIVSKWVPLFSRGKSSAFIAFGGRVGGYLALAVSGLLIIWMTPLSTPAQLAVGDLLDAPRLCHELHAAAEGSEPEDPLRQQCFETFSQEARALVNRHGARYAAELEQERQRLEDEGKNPKNASVKLPDLPPAEKLLLVAQWNQVISTRGFFTEAEGVSIQKEARRLMQTQAEDAGALSSQQVERLNRLVVEGLHRKSIKKLYVRGWRPMMFVYGSLGLLVAGLIWWSCRTTPAEHPSCNDAEVALISGSKKPAGPAKPAVGGVPLSALLRSFSMWMSCSSQWFTNIGWLFLMTWAPRYYTTVHKLSIEEVALLASIPPLVGWIGMLSGGLVTDVAARTLGLRWGRALPISLSRFLAMAAYLACLFEPSPYLAMALFSVVAFATDLGTAPAWAFTQDVGGRHVGSVLGWGNMWGNLGAAITPPLLIWIVGEAERWDYAFMTCAGAFFCAGVCSLGINATIPIGPQESIEDGSSEAGGS